jgi:hypothetical protein
MTYQISSVEEQAFESVIIFWLKNISLILIKDIQEFLKRLEK